MKFKKEKKGKKSAAVVWTDFYEYFFLITKISCHSVWQNCPFLIHFWFAFLKVNIDYQVSIMWRIGEKKGNSEVGLKRARRLFLWILIADFPVALSSSPSCDRISASRNIIDAVSSTRASGCTHTHTWKALTMRHNYTPPPQSAYCTHVQSVPGPRSILHTIAHRVHLKRLDSSRGCFSHCIYVSVTRESPAWQRL